MFIVLLRFSGAKSKAGELMAGHNDWIRRGLEDGVFLLIGSLQPSLGGAILAHDVTRADLLERVHQDPFVVRDVVEAEILEVSPSKTDPRLAFLLCGPAT